MKNRSVILIFVCIVFVVPVSVNALVNWYEKKYQSLPVLGKTKDHRIGDFHLQNQDAVQKSIDSWQGRIVVANFFFTHCPVICPRMTKNIKRVQQAVPGDDQLRFSSFSVDPDRDSPAVLKKYAASFAIDTQNWDLFTGPKKEIYSLARNSFMVVATDGDGGPDDFIHSDKLVLLDKKQRIRGYYDGTNKDETEQLISDIKKLKHEN